MSRVALMGENSVEYISALLNIWNNGDCAVLLDWRIPFGTAVDMMREAGVTHCYIEKRFLRQIKIPLPADLVWITYERNSNTAEELPRELYRKFRVNDSFDEAVVLYSSGTTGKAKGIVLTHFALQTNADAILDYMQPQKNDCMYIAKTLSHSSTLTGELLVALKAGMRLIVGPTIVPPRLVFNNIKKYGVSLICLNPTLLAAYADECTKNKYDLSSLRIIYVSGSVLNDRIYTAAHKAFNGIEIYNVYGLSEAGPRVTAQRADCCQSNSVGKPVKGVEVILVDEKGTPVCCGERGIVHVKTPSRYSGYISGIEKFSSLYRDWLNTGDMGFIDENGELHILDRIDDVIILDSHKIYPSEVQQQIIKNTSITECVVTSVEHKKNIFLGCLYTGASEEVGLIRKLRNVLLPYEVPRYFLKCESLPRTANGKVSFKEAAAILQSAFEKELQV